MTRTAAAPLLGMGEWEYCPDRDAEHDPVPAAVADPELSAIGYFTVECRACGQTTGYPMPEPDRVDWG